MITEAGKANIRGYMAGYNNAIAHQIAVGIGDRPESSLDTYMHFEAGRSEITAISLSPDSQRIIFKADVPDDYEGEVREIALFANISELSSNQTSEHIITSFDSDQEGWMMNGSPATFTNSMAVRLGLDALHLAPVSNSTETAYLDSPLDLTRYAATDKLIFAYNVGTSNTDFIRVHLLTDSANYYTYTLAAPHPGYHIMEANINSAAVTGAPRLDGITQIAVAVTSGVGLSDVFFDGIRAQSTDTVGPSSVMVARVVLDNPFRKLNGQSQNIEFELEVNL